MNWSPAQLEAKRRGEAHAAEMLTAGQAVNPAKGSVGVRQMVALRPNRWHECPVCHAPAINPSTGECEMAVCETRRPRSSGPFDHNGDIAIW